MINLKYHSALCFTLIVFTFITSCVKEEDPIVYKFQCDEGVGIYELRQSSFTAVPYYGTNQIIFLDSLGNQSLFILNEAQTFLADGKFIKYNVFEQGDTVTYCYKSERKSFNLMNESLGISFNVTLYCSPYYSDPALLAKADFLDIFYNDLDDSLFTSWQVFRKLIDQRTFPEANNWENNSYPSMTFIDRSFNEVERTDFQSPKLVVFYNKEYGIVAFRDKSKKLWRYDSKR